MSFDAKAQCMRLSKPVYYLTALLLVAFVLACDHNEQSCRLREEDIAQIRAMEAAHVQDVLAGNWDAMIPSYAEDVVFMPPNQPEIRGRTALRSWMEANNPDISAYELSFDEVEGCGDIAYVKGSYRMTFFLEGVSEPMSDTGRFMYILRRSADGSWLVTRDIFSSDQPMP